MKSETGMRRLAVGLAMSPVHSYTPTARTTFSGAVTLWVWADEGADASANARVDARATRRPLHEVKPLAILGGFMLSLDAAAGLVVSPSVSSIGRLIQGRLLSDS